MSEKNDGIAGLGGISVIVSDHLPIHPSHKEDARRIVRHGMADVLDWLGEKVGPKPGDPTHVLLIGDDYAVVSAAFAGVLKESPR